MADLNDGEKYDNDLLVDNAAFCLDSLIELAAVCETSLDYRPEFRRALANANSAIAMVIE